MNLPARVRKLLSLPAHEWNDLVRAQVAILHASWRLRRVRIGDLVRGAGSPHAGVNSAQSGMRHGSVQQHDPVPQRAARLALALKRAADHGPVRPECLVRSIALRNLLTNTGITGSVIRVGVRRDEKGFLAHAWVELNGAVIGDEPSHISRFTRLEQLDVRGLN